jgi:hypothetical protein
MDRRRHKTEAQFYEQDCAQSKTESSNKMILHRRRQAITEASDPLWMTREAGPARVWLFQALLLDAMTTYIGRSGLTAALRVKLTEVVFVSWIW